MLLTHRNGLDVAGVQRKNVTGTCTEDIKKNSARPLTMQHRGRNPTTAYWNEEIPEETGDGGPEKKGETDTPLLVDGVRGQGEMKGGRRQKR